MARKRLINFYKNNERNYEICILLNSKLSEESLKEELTNIKEIILKNDGKIVENLTTKIKDFAYILNTNKEKKGYYSCFYVQLNSLKVSDLKKKLIIENNILRIIITLANPKKQLYGIFSKDYEDNRNKNNLFSYDDPNNLEKFLGENGRISKNRNISKKNQRKIAKTIKLTRTLALLPFIER